MTSTPTIWKPVFYPNNVALGGLQSAPQTIALANGNFLVMWEDDTNGPSPGIDIMGRLYTADGRPAGGAFQVNGSIIASDETGPQAVALPDGGYVVAYGGFFEATGGFINVERFDSAGNSVFSSQILDERSSLTAWTITADIFGNYTVAYEIVDDLVIHTDPEFSINIYSITYDHSTNAASPVNVEAAQNSREEDDHLGAVATFANGNIITFYDELDYTTVFDIALRSMEFTITDPLTGAIIRDATEISESRERDTGRAQDVAVLTGGQFVMLYNIDKDSFTSVGGGFVIGFPELVMRIGSSHDAGAAIGPEIHIDDSFSDGGTGTPDDGDRGYENARVVALRDGGFLVAWLRTAMDGEPPKLIATRFDVSGNQIGDQIVVSTDVTQNDNMLANLELTSDGRVLVTYLNAAHDIASVILDPRENVIVGSGAGETLTTQIGSTQIFGEGGNDTIYGQDGNDDISGGGGFDTLHGGKGNDTFYLFDTTPAGDFDVVQEKANGGTDTVYLRGSAALLLVYTLAENVETAIIDGVETVDLFGNALDNRLLGSSAGDFFFGNGGNDFLAGRGGNDQLFGGEGDDTFDGGAGFDVLTGGTGADLYEIRDADEVREVANGGRDTIQVYAQLIPQTGYFLPEFVEHGIIVGNGRFDLTGNAEQNRLTGNDGANALSGLAGDDRLQGNGGTDVLAGGGGRDVFVFLRLDDSGTGKGGRDLVGDFEFGDVIDVSAIDANVLTAGDQAFRLDTNGVLNAGEILIQRRADGLLLSFSTDRDPDAEMQITVAGVTSLAAADFLF